MPARHQNQNLSCCCFSFNGLFWLASIPLAAAMFVQFATARSIQHMSNIQGGYSHGGGKTFNAWTDATGLWGRKRAAAPAAGPVQEPDDVPVQELSMLMADTDEQSLSPAPPGEPVDEEIIFELLPNSYDDETQSSMKEAEYELEGMEIEEEKRRQRRPAMRKRDWEDGDSLWGRR